METISFDSHGTRCEAWCLPARTEVLTTDARRPCPLWGSSCSGSHEVVAAAQDPRTRAVISQGVARDGLAALVGVQRAGGSGKPASLTGAGLRGATCGVLHRAAVLVAIVGEPGSEAVISAPGSVAGSGHSRGPTSRSEMCAPGILRIVEQDDLAPVSAVEEVA